MKKIVSVLALCSLVLSSALSCSKKDEPNYSISVNESYVEPTAPEGTTTYRLQETPVVVAEGVDKDLADLLKSYFDGYNKTESFTVLKSYTPTAYMNLLDEHDEFRSYHMHIDAEVVQASMYWKSTYGEDAIMILNEIKSQKELSEEHISHAVSYFKETYGKYPFDIELTEGVELTFNYAISGSSGEDSGDMTVCAVRFASGEEEYGGWKLIMCGADDLMAF